MQHSENDAGSATKGGHEGSKRRTAGELRGGRVRSIKGILWEREADGEGKGGQLGRKWWKYVRWTAREVYSFSQFRL